MLTNLKIRHFKSHKDTSLEVSNLTVFTGLNGVGKSSVFQALLLLRQTFNKNRLHVGLDLNHPLCRIGTAQDAVYQYADSNSISICLETEDAKKHEWEFDASRLPETFLKRLDKGTSESSKGISLFSTNFQYLSASRWAPQESYPKETYAVETERQISLEYGKCELVAHFLDFHGRRQRLIFQSLINKTSSSDYLLDQSSAWSREISNNVNVKIEPSDTGFQLKYSFDVDGDFPTNDFRAENVGFGITYALPIIVAVLAAEKDSLIFIENPEAHIHPAGQAKLAELLALAAQAGVQIFVETHSDHIINGILVAVKNFETTGRGISHDKVRVHYFDRDETKHATRSTPIPVLSGGRIKNPPEGFFDQIAKDRKQLMGF